MPADPALWKRLITAPNMLAYAAFSAFVDFRILALGHEGMLLHQDAEGANPFLDEALAWLKGTRHSTVALSAKPTDALVQHRTSSFNVQVLQNQLAARGYRVDTIETSIDSLRLAQAAVLIVPNSWGDFTAPEFEAITQFVNDGGGLLAAGLGWSWPHSLESYPMNRLLKNFGVKWTQN